MRLFPDRTFSDERSHSTRWAFWRWFDIWKDGQIYLTRLTLFRCPLFQVMLHWIKQPDQDRGIHDHPWRFFSIVLWGEYYETEAKPYEFGGHWWVRDLKTRYVRFLNWKGLGHAHKITRIAEKGVLTLVFTGGKRKSWGFYEEDRTRRRHPKGDIPVTYTHWLDYLVNQL